MNIEELKCPNCDTEMLTMYCDYKYCYHACYMCKLFFELQNPEDYEQPKAKQILSNVREK